MRYHVTKSELEILRVLWKAETPLSRGGILERSENKTWQDNSIHILLNDMLRKELIEPAGFTRSGKVWARLYAPKLSAEDYYADLLSAGPALDPVKFLALILKDNPDGQTLLRMREEINKALADVQP